MILLTDGISQPHDYSALLARAQAQPHRRRDGRARNRRRCGAPAQDREGDRRQRLRDEARARPAQDLRQGDAPERGAHPDHRCAAGAATRQQPGRALAGGAELPSLSGNVVTRLRPGAQVDLIARSASDETEPALAQWGYGTGRVVSWTPGLGAPWATEWTPQTALWNDAVRWVARALPPEPAAATARAGTSTGARGRPRGGGPDARIPPDRRCSSDPAARPAAISAEREHAERVHGRCRRTVRRAATSSTLSLPAALGGPRRLRVDVPYAAEYLPTGLGRSTLGQLAEQTGGSLLAPGDPGATRG